jgi:acetyl/propionyl-CoA carboxylase alpha subunit
MRDALNGFVIRGISSNIPFQAALMQHPVFHSGIFDTGFIPKHYPTGFDASMVPHDDPALLVSVAAYVYRAFTDRSASISGQLQGHERLVSDNWMVIRLNKEGNEHHPVVAKPIPAATTSNTRAIRAQVRLEARRIAVQRHLQRRALHPAGRAPQDQVQPVPLGHPRRLHGDERPRRRTAGPDAREAAARPVQVPAVPMPGLLREVAVRSVRK